MISHFRFYQHLEQIPAEINALWDEAASESFFLSRWWFQTVLAAGLNHGDKPAIGVLCAANGSPRAIIPGRIIKRHLGPFVASELQGLTGMYSCYFRPLIAPSNDADLAAEALGKALAESMGRKRSIHFDALDAGWASLRAFEGGLRKGGLWIERYHHFGNWYEDLSGRSFDDYFRARDGALRETIRRKGRTLERQGRISYEIVSSTARLDEAVRAYDSVYARSWKVPEPYPTFYPLLMSNACREGALRIGICRIDGLPVAVQLWILWHQCATVLKLAHDERAKKLSVGSLLTTYMIRYLMIEDGVARIDFGRGDDPYKSRWTTHRHQRVGMVAAKPGSIAGLYMAARQFGRWGKTRWSRTRVHADPIGRPPQAGTAEEIRPDKEEQRKPL